eukprot:362576-Prymnesium_polylepis.1
MACAPLEYGTSSPTSAGAGCHPKLAPAWAHSCLDSCARPAVGRQGRARVPAAGGEAQGRRVHGAAEAVAADAPWPVRRVQPRVRPRHRLRPQDGRPDRVDPDEPAGDGAVGVQPQ